MAKKVWLIEPMNVHTNEVIARMLAPEEISEVRGKQLNGEVGKIKVWTLTDHQYIMLDKSSRDPSSGIVFRLCRPKPTPIEVAPLHKPFKRHSKDPKLAKAKTDLKEITGR